MNYLHLCLSARVARGDLKAIDAELESATASQPVRMVLLKAAMLSVANVADLEARCGDLYKEHPDLKAIYGPKRKHFEFAKYLRNKVVGHFVEGLTAQTLEWKPELYALLRKDDEGIDLYISYAALETAINTYAGDEDKHKLFESETDLNYPPDRQRYLNFLGDTVHAAIAYTDKLAFISAAAAVIPDYEEEWMELARKAGQVDFKFLSKGGR